MSSKNSKARAIVLESMEDHVRQVKTRGFRLAHPCDKDCVDQERHNEHGREVAQLFSDRYVRTWERRVRQYRGGSNG